MNKIYKKPNTIEKYMFFYIYESTIFKLSSAELAKKSLSMYRISIPDDFPDLCCKKYLGRYNFSYYINDKDIENRLARLRRIITGNNENINFEFIFVTKKDDTSISGVFSFNSPIKKITGSNITVGLTDNNLYEVFKNSIKFTTKIIW